MKKVFALCLALVAAISLGGCNAATMRVVGVGATALIAGAVVGNMMAENRQQVVEDYEDEEVEVAPIQYRPQQRSSSDGIWLRQEQVGRPRQGNLAPGYYDPGRVCGYNDP
ncbi:MAG: hypothetical protein JWO43_670, partial [Candidatus Adlerbacteria bacterium]|nr:hypothetical protein [Candidatus Adlerbacteria bacterium]